MLQRIIDLMQSKGHAVSTFMKSSEGIENTLSAKIASFFLGVYSVNARKEVAASLSELKPDIVQIQNLYPLISPAILYVIKSFKIPIVMRVSNYRLLCPNGLMLSHGRLCERCRGGKEYWCVLKNCEGSIPKSVGYALRNWAARIRRDYLDNVDLYYTQTGFQRDLLLEEGFSKEKISVVPNMTDIPPQEKIPDIGEYIAFVGRVSSEKGVVTFCEASEKLKDLQFHIAGDYQRMSHLPETFADVRFLGGLDKEELKHFYKKCRVLVFASLWYEGFPSVLIEAMVNGKPVICSNIGGMPEIVEDGKTGLLFEPGNVEDLAEKIAFLYSRPELCEKMGMEGRKKVMEEYSSEKYYSRLMDVYTKVLQVVA